MNYPSYQPAMDERMKMQMQMYYNNMYNFGAAPINTQHNYQERVRVKDRERRDDSNVVNGTMRNQPREIEIQTDLTLMNVEIDVFPRNEVKKRKYTKAENKIKKEKKSSIACIAKKLQRSAHLEGAQSVSQHEHKENNEYVIAVNLKQVAAQMQLEEVEELRKRQSQFDNFEREIRENLGDIVKDTELDYFKECLCKGQAQESHSFQCPQCKYKYHYKCLGLQKERPAERCHVCKLMQFDPVNEVKEIIGTYYLQDIPNNKFQVDLSLTQYEYFLFKRIRINEIELRCLRIGDDSQYSQQTWPDQVLILINDKKICEIPALSITSSLKKRKDGAISISNFIFREPQADDQLSHVKITILSKKKNNEIKVKDGLFYFGIYFIEKITLDQLYSKYQKSVKIYGGDFITSLMDIGDYDVELQKVICTLKDPYTGILMHTPVRGVKCLHGQCFDLKTYLLFMYVSKARTWKCPVCTKQAKQFLMDKQILQLIKKATRDHVSVKDVSFMKDGMIFLKISNEQMEDEQDNSKTAKKNKQIEKRAKQEAKESKSASQ